jgi:uncharacterized membrane protein
VNPAWLSKLRNRARLSPGLARLAVPSLFIAFFLWFAALRLVQHYSFGTNAFDLSIFDYGLYFTLKGRFLWTPFLADPNLLADHFSPLLLTLLPLYLLHEGPHALLIVQAGMVVASGVPLFLSARALLGGRVAALGITVAYFGNLYLVRGLLYDFHLEMWIPAFFLTGLWLIEIRQQSHWGTAVLAAAMLIKEDVPIYVAVLSLYFAVTGQRRVAVHLALASAVYGAFVAFVGLPALVGGASPPNALSAWMAVGHTIPEILGYFIAHPVEAVRVFWTRTLLRLLGSFGFLPLLSPWTLLATVPGLFVNFSGSHPQRNLWHYYAAPALPLLAWATIGALRRIQAVTGRVVVHVVVAGVVLMNLHFARMFHVTERDREGLALIRTLSRTASIAAPSHMVPHLPKREEIYVVGSTWRQEPVDFVVLDLQRRGWPLRRHAVVALARELEGDSSYEKIVERDGYVLFRRNVVEARPPAPTR